MCPSGPATESSPVYAVGDLVEFLNSPGEIEKIWPEDDMLHRWPIQVRFRTGHIRYFTPEGYMDADLTGARLQVVGKKKVPVKKWRWVYKDYWKCLHVTSEHYSETEMVNSVVLEGIQKVDSTMIEVDE